MKRFIITGIVGLLLAACSPMNDEPEVAPTAPEATERYFTLTNGDEQYPLIYMGGAVLLPSEVSKPITLYGDKDDYTFYWGIDGRQIPDKLHIDMTGKPNGITVNYTVKYE